MDCCMDCCLTEEGRLEKNRSRKIDRSIKKKQREEKYQIKLLLLGTGESGKSTFIRQMRIIYKDGYSDIEKMEYIKVIMQNILSSMQTMIEAMDCLQISYASNSNLRNAAVIRTAVYETFVELAEMYPLMIKELWNDAGIQECYMRRREYQLTDSIKYYLEHIDRITDQCYLPTENDILHVRVPTSGLVEYNFKVEKTDFRMIDVGGQRSERKKWIHCFDNVKAIIFLAAISEYDQVLHESDRLNRLVESINVFKRISNYEWFNGTSIVLFFNKCDLLEEKIMYSDLKRFFPAFQGPTRNYEMAKKFIADMFTQVMPNRRVYTHFTCATDTGNMKIVFDSVKDAVLSDNLNRFGMF